MTPELFGLLGVLAIVVSVALFGIFYKEKNTHAAR